MVRYAACLAGLLLALPAAAAARPGLLDSSFGVGGKVVTSLPAAGKQSEVVAAMTPSEGIAVWNRATILMHRPDGRLDPTFGSGGRLSIPAQLDGFEFAPGGFAVDSQGRLLVAGTAVAAGERGMPGPAGSGFFGPTPAEAMVIRYSPTGSLDRRFGNDGAAITDFGLPAPSSTVFGSFHYGKPALTVTGLALDSEGRPVLTGTYVIEVGDCRDLADVSFTAAFLGRLTASGIPDSSFGSGGATANSDLLVARHPLADSRSGVSVEGEAAEQCERSLSPVVHTLFRVGESGQLEVAHQSTTTAFQEEIGWIDSLDRLGRTLLLAQPYLPSRPEHPKVVLDKITRLRVSGGADPAFGHDGTAQVRLAPGASFTSIGADDRSRPLLIGSVWKSSPFGPGRGTSRLLLMRLTGRGKVDRNFGRNGRLIAKFEPGTSVIGRQVLVDGKGRIIVVGTIKSPSLSSHFGLALARYQLGG